MEVRFPDQGQLVEHRVQIKHDEASVCTAGVSFFIFSSLFFLTNALLTRFAILVIFIFKICDIYHYFWTSHFAVLCQTIKNPWKAMYVGTHLECSAEFWSLCSRWVLVFVRNQQAESFHFLMSDSSQPNLRKCQNLQVWNFLLNSTSADLQAGRDESDTVDEAQAVVDAKARAFYTSTCLTLDPLYSFIVCDFRKSSRLARPDGARTRSNSSQFCVWGTGNISFEVSATCSRGHHWEHPQEWRWMQFYLLPLVFDEYRKISGRDIEDSIKREMSGSLEDVFLAIGASLLDNAPL